MYADRRLYYYFQIGRFAWNLLKYHPYILVKLHCVPGTFKCINYVIIRFCRKLMHLDILLNKKIILVY